MISLIRGIKTTTTRKQQQQQQQQTNMGKEGKEWEVYYKRFFSTENNRLAGGKEGMGLAW